MHGTVHPLSETLNDHHLGRCSALPQLLSWDELGISGMPGGPKYDQDAAWFKSLTPEDQAKLLAKTGEEWFNGLTKAQQLELMGPGKYAAWQDGKFNFKDLSKPYNDKVYGLMTREATLKELLNNNPVEYEYYLDARQWLSL